MAFTTLAEKFEQSSKDIYERFSPRQEPDAQPYVNIIPDSPASRNKIFNDTRSVPIVSTGRDQTRVSKFLASPNGNLFIAKQLLLQTGNTFVNTKIFNPLSTSLSVIPFVHPRRHLVQSLFRQDAPGILQNTTVNTIASKFESIGQLQDISAGRTGLIRGIGGLAKNFLSTQLKNASNAILPIPQNYLASRPEYSVFYGVTKGGPVVFDPQPLNQRGIPKLGVLDNVKSTLTTKARTAITNFAKNKLNLSLPKALRGAVPLIQDTPINEKSLTFEAEAKRFKENFYNNLPNRFKENPAISRLKDVYFSADQANSTGVSETGYNTNDPRVYAKSGKTNLKDSYNIATPVQVATNDRINYDNIVREQENKDIIKFIFTDASSTDPRPVHFRAFLSSIRESIKPEFNDQRYIGRTERFVTYNGVKRSVNLSFNIVAFSPDEIEGVWSRINYLTGRTFPKDVQNGFMVPPLFKITVGNIYENQPCYIESLDYEFLDENTTFDIDQEVPFAVNVTMQLSLLEKRSRFFDSPFYKITEEVNKTQVELFDRNINATLQQANQTLPMFNIE